MAEKIVPSGNVKPRGSVTPKKYIKYNSGSGPKSSIAQHDREVAREKKAIQSRRDEKVDMFMLILSQTHVILFLLFVIAPAVIFFSNNVETYSYLEQSGDVVEFDSDSMYSDIVSGDYQENAFLLGNKIFIDGLDRAFGAIDIVADVANSIYDVFNKVVNLIDKLL
jgi:hypothetical protein